MVEAQEMKLLGASIFNSTQIFMQICYRQTGRMVDPNQFRTRLLVDNRGLGSITFTTEIAQLQQDLQGVLPYKSMLFNSYLNEEQLDQMRRRMTHLPIQRWEAVRTMAEKYNRQRQLLKIAALRLRDVCNMRYANLPEDFDNFVYVSITYENATPLPAMLNLQYRGTILELPFPPNPLRRQ